jgi:chemotaxis protein methyltransferase WspC
LAFRQTKATVQSRYFSATGDTWQLDSGIRRLVTFSVANLVQLGDADCHGPFDVIFCRNLMIYLTPESRKHLLSSLESRLAEDGWLAVGPAEPASLTGRGYTAWGDDADFLFRRGPSKSETRQESAIPPRPTARPTSTSPLRAKPPTKAAIPRETWADARSLADSGRLDEALSACQRLIARDGHTAEGYVLIGIVQHARGDLDAADAAFRSALYLDPDQVDALTHGALLCDRRGQTDRAASLRDRLGRLRASGGGA